MAREKVEVVEVGLRDGLQILDYVMPTADKLAWLEAEHAAGVRRFEAASFVPPKLMPQMADAAEVVAAAKRLPGITVTALVPNLKGATAAIAAGADILIAPVSASEAHSRANVRRTPDEMVAELGRICEARDAGRPPDPGRCRHRHHLRLHHPGRGAGGRGGADRRGLPGGGRRHDRARRHGRLRQPGAGPPPVRARCGRSPATGSTRRTSTTRAASASPTWWPRSTSASAPSTPRSAASAAARTRPGASGNVATEDLVFMLEEMGFDTGIDLEALIAGAAPPGRSCCPGQTLYGKLAGAGLTKTYPQPRRTGRLRCRATTILRPRRPARSPASACSSSATWSWARAAA